MKKYIYSLWIICVISSFAHLISEELEDEFIESDNSFLYPICGKPGDWLTDYHAISQVIDRMTTSWNENQGYGFADDFARNATFVNIYGTVFMGKECIEERHRKILNTFLKGSKFEVVERIIIPTGTWVAIAHVFWEVTNIQKPEENTPGMLSGVFTHFLVKNPYDRRWEIIASQNTLSAISDTISGIMKIMQEDHHLDVYESPCIRISHIQ